MTNQSIQLEQMREEDIPFLIELWHMKEVMRYADEFPWLRGWSKKMEPESCWSIHSQQKAEHGELYSQFILKATGGVRIGESMIYPLEDGFTFGKWQKPAGVLTVMGDIKLIPDYWGQGLGSAGMREMVKWVFKETAVDLYVVPPNRRNPAAKRVYEKAGFASADTGFYRGHEIVTLTRERFDQMSGTHYQQN